MRKNKVLLLLMGFFALSLIAQTNRAKFIGTPLVSPDGKVTFTLKAPQATTVELSGQFLTKNERLQKNDAGVWNITLGPIKPDIYPYNFIVDGISVADPSNMNLFPNEGFKASLLEVPSEKPALTSVQNVPHGEVRYCQVQSDYMQATRPLLVYTPPGYETSGKKYPVFYLVSGTTDTEETWFKVGKINVILDNLIAQGKAVPMIVVMPYGNMMNGTPGPATIQAADMYKDFGEELTRTLIPYVESKFRTFKDRDSRAIAGFSRGGGQSLFTGLNHLELFANIGSYSAYLTPQVVDAYFPKLIANPQLLNSQLKVFWLGVGSSDFLYKDAITFMDLLKNKGVNHKSLITEGGHTWMNARHYLSETLQLFFKK